MSFFESYDVVIIGGGIAGAAAAHKIITTVPHATVALLEARDRLGGRIHSKLMVGAGNDNTSFFYEEGANWLQGASVKHSPAAALLRSSKCQVPLVVCDDENDKHSGLLFDTNGKELESDDEDKLEEATEAAFETLEAMRKDFKEDIPLAVGIDRMMQRVREHSNNSRIPKKVTAFLSSGRGEREDARREMLLRNMLHMETAHEAGGDETLMSFHNWDDDEETPGEQLLVLGGYNKVVHYLMDEARKHGSSRLSVVLNAEVQTIRVDLEAEDERVHVQFLNHQQNKTFVATKCVIVAVPHAVLKYSLQTQQGDRRGCINFVPPLPAPKVNAICSQIATGCYCKILLVFREEDVFWPREELFFSCLKERIGAWGLWVNILAATSPKRVFVDNGSNKSRRMIGNFPRVTALMCNVGEREGRRLEALPLAQVQHEAMAHLQTMFGADGALPTPIRCECSRWTLDPFARGAYSYVAVGGSTEHSRRELAKPCHDDAIFFCGEACDTMYPSTTHGAFRSGVSTADSVKRIHFEGGGDDDESSSSSSSSSSESSEDE